MVLATRRDSTLTVVRLPLYRSDHNLEKRVTLYYPTTNLRVSEADLVPMQIFEGTVG